MLNLNCPSNFTTQTDVYLEPPADMLEPDVHSSIWNKEVSADKGIGAEAAANK